MPYRGAISVPDIGKVNNNRLTRRSPSPPPIKTEVEPAVRYTSKVTTMINHAPSRSSESSDFERNESPRVSEAKPAQRDRIVTRISNIWPPPPTSNEPIVARSAVPVSTKAEPQKLNKAPAYNSAIMQNRSYSPPTVSQSSKNQVQMRHSSSRKNTK